MAVAFVTWAWKNLPGFQHTGGDDGSILECQCSMIPTPTTVENCCFINIKKRSTSKCCLNALLNYCKFLQKYLSSKIWIWDTVLKNNSSSIGMWICKEKGLCVTTLNPHSLIKSIAVTFTNWLLNLGNRQHVTGKPGTGTVMGNFSVGGVLTSPFFPSQYPRDLGAEYIISCLADNSPDCRVRLLFNDFQLAGVSIMEVL